MGVVMQGEKPAPKSSRNKVDIVLKEWKLE